MPTSMGVASLTMDLTDKPTLSVRDGGRLIAAR
jgi:hypothetical protein